MIDEIIPALPWENYFPRTLHKMFLTRESDSYYLKEENRSGVICFDYAQIGHSTLNKYFCYRQNLFLFAKQVLTSF